MSAKPNVEDIRVCPHHRMTTLEARCPWCAHDGDITETIPLEEFLRLAGGKAEKCWACGHEPHHDTGCVSCFLGCPDSAGGTP